MLTQFPPFKVTVLAAAFLLSGCAGLTPLAKVSPDASVTTIPALTPSATATLRSDLAIERWWTLFGDPALEQLMTEALARNYDLEAAVARVREAQASLDIARAAQSPTLDAQARSSRDQR